MRRYGLFSVALSLIGLGLGGACGGPSGRVKDPSEANIVGSRRAGAEVYRPTVKAALDSLLGQYRGEVRAQGKRTIAFIGVENKTREELRDILDAINQTVETTLTESGIFTVVGQEFVEAAIREIGGRREQLFLAKGREDFKSVLGKQGIVPDYLLFAKLTSMTTEAEAEREVFYQVTLDMLDANTGEKIASKVSESIKGYTK